MQYATKQRINKQRNGINEYDGKWQGLVSRETNK